MDRRAGLIWKVGRDWRLSFCSFEVGDIEVGHGMLVGRNKIGMPANTRQDNTSLTFQGLRVVLVGSFGRCAMGE